MGFIMLCFLNFLIDYSEWASMCIMCPMLNGMIILVPLFIDYLKLCVKIVLIEAASNIIMFNVYYVVSVFDTHTTSSF